MVSGIMVLVLSLGLYPRNGVVTEVNRLDNTAVITDSYGHMWKAGGFDLHEGNAVTMYMDSMYTYTLYDDRIVDITVQNLDRGKEGKYVK